MTFQDFFSEFDAFAKTNNLSHDRVDFDIIKYKTIAKLRTGQLTSQENPIEKPIVYEANDEIPLDIWLNPDIDISQEYDIVFKKRTVNQKFIVEIDIGANKPMTAAAAFIKHESIIGEQANLENMLIVELNKKKLKSRMMIGIFDNTMKEGVKALIASLAVSRKLQRDYKIILYKAPDYIQARDDKIRYCFKEKMQKDNTSLKKSTIVAVDANEILVEYIKSKHGKSARGMNGMYYLVSEPATSYWPVFEIGASVAFEDTDDKMIYKAKNSGFVIFDESKLDVKEELEINKIDFKTGSIDLGMHKEAKIEIKSTPVDEDAIAGDMSARAYTVNVSGGVGAGASLIANDCIIKGQTHASSNIACANASVHKHKGHLISNNARIDILENGFITAERVIISTVFGGIIEADKAEIASLGSNCEIYFRDELFIEDPHGRNIKIFITPTATQKEKEDYKKIITELHDAEHEIVKKQEKLKSDLGLIERNKMTIERIKAKLKLGGTDTHAMSEQLKRFSAVATEARTLIAELNNAQEIATKDHAALDSQENSLLGAVITVNKPWKNGAYIRVILLDSTKEIAIQLPDNSNVKKIWVEKREDTGYKIMTSVNI